jgi:hypothetical protein
VRSILALTIATTLAGFALGAYATYRYAPALSDAPASVAVGLIVCVLVGGACGLACLYVYFAIHAFATEPALGSGLASAGLGSGGSPDADIFANAVYSIASESGVLLAVAAGVYLLAPSAREPALNPAIEPTS